MARKTIVELTDDLDGKKAAETVSFALDGRPMEIDLSSANAAKLRKALEPYIEAGRRVRGGARVATVRLRPPRHAPPRRRRPSASGPAPAATRCPTGAGSAPRSSRRTTARRTPSAGAGRASLIMETGAALLTRFQKRAADSGACRRAWKSSSCCAERSCASPGPGWRCSPRSTTIRTPTPTRSSGRRGPISASVSHQAVYDVLRALTTAGLVRRIEPAGSVPRYESRVATTITTSSAARAESSPTSTAPSATRPA